MMNSSNSKDRFGQLHRKQPRTCLLGEGREEGGKQGFDSNFPAHVQLYVATEKFNCASATLEGLGDCGSPMRKQLGAGHSASNPWGETMKNDADPTIDRE